MPYKCPPDPPPLHFYTFLFSALCLSFHFLATLLSCFIWQRGLWRHKTWNIVWGQALLLFRLVLLVLFFLFTVVCVWYLYYCIPVLFRLALHCLFAICTVSFILFSNYCYFLLFHSILVLWFCYFCVKLFLFFHLLFVLLA